MKLTNADAQTPIDPGDGMASASASASALAKAKVKDNSDLCRPDLPPHAHRTALHCEMTTALFTRPIAAQKKARKLRGLSPA